MKRFDPDNMPEPGPPKAGQPLPQLELLTIAKEVSAEMQRFGYNTAVQEPLVLEIAMSMASSLLQKLITASADERTRLIVGWGSDVLAYREYIVSQPDQPGNPEAN